MVSPAAASQLVINTQPSATATAGSPFATQPVVYIEDQYGNLETGDNATQVTAALNSGTGPLQGTTTVTVAGGIATFIDLSDNLAETITLQFTSNPSLTTPTSTNIVVSPAAASQLVIDTQPSATAMAGVAFSVQPVVDIEDAYGNLITTDNTTQVSASLASGTGPLQGTTTVTVSGGIATFTDLTDNTAETITLQFTSNPAYTAATSSAIVVSPAAASQLVINTQPSATATAGSPFATQPVVYVEDQYGNLETGDNATQVTAALNSGTGPLQGTTTVTVAGGIATFADLGDNTAETLSLQFTSNPALTTPTSTNIVVSPAAASQLVIDTQPSATAMAGVAFSVQPVVDIEDAYGNLITTDNTTQVSASLASGTGPLQGTTTVTVSGGIATFTDLTDNTAETITLQFTSNPAYTAATSSAIVVSPAAASQLVINTQPSPTATAGSPFATQPVVYVEDQYGNLETGDNTTQVTVALNSGTGPLQGTTTVTASGGIATFADLGDNTAETLSLQFTSNPALTTPTSTNIVVSPAAASQLVIDTQPSATAMAGVAFSVQPVVDIEDAYGNLITTDNTTQVSASLASGTGPLQGTTTVTVSGGIATFTDLSDNTAETITLQFTSNPAYTAATSSAIVVSPAAASQLVINTQPSATATAGAAFSTQPVIYVADQYGNLETGDNTTQVTVALNSGTGPLQGTMTVTVAGGVATFIDLSDNLAETITLQFTSNPSLTAVTSNNVVVNPAAPSILVIQTQPSATATAGSPFSVQPVVYVEDQYGNLETGDNTTQVTAALNSGTGPLQGTTTVTVAGGIATFANLGDNTAETLSLRFTSNPATTTPTSTNIVVSPAAASQLVIDTQPSATATAGVAFSVQPVVDIEDAYGNLITTDNTTQVSASLASGTGPLQGTTTVTVSGGIATFTDLSDNKAETVTLGFTSNPAYTAATSSAIVVSPAAASQLVIHTQPSATATANVPFNPQPVVYVEDSFGNLETGDNSTQVTVSLNTGAGPLLGNTTVTVSGGVGVFANLANGTAETITLKFTSVPDTTQAISNPIVVARQVASQLVMHTQPSATATAGQVFATQPVVYVEDAAGYLVIGDNTTQVTVSLRVGTGPLLGTTTVTVSGGVATFTNLSDDKAETIVLVFTAPMLTKAQAQSTIVSPAAASRLSIAAPATATTGRPFTITVTAYDPYNNVATGYRGTVQFTSSDRRATLPPNYTFTASNAGVHSFVNAVVMKSSGVQTITVTDLSNRSINGTTSVNVTSPPVGLVIDSAAQGRTASNLKSRSPSSGPGDARRHAWRCHGVKPLPSPAMPGCSRNAQDTARNHVFAELEGNLHAYLMAERLSSHYAKR